MRSRISLFSAAFAVSVSIAAVTFGALGAGCDTESSSKAPEGQASAAASAAAPPPKPPPEPKPPQIVVDDKSCTVDGEVVLFEGPDPAGRIATTLTGKPFVDGQIVAVSASRDAKVPRVAAVVQALKKVKAKSALIKSAKRDSTMGELELTIDHGPIADCSATGIINKDGSIAVWTAGGGVGKRFVRGFAGPDLTLGSEGLQKQSSTCDSPVWLLAADDSLPWGLAYDLALTAIGSGTAMKATKTVLLVTPPVAGRKVTE